MQKVTVLSSVPSLCRLTIIFLQFSVPQPSNECQCHVRVIFHPLSPPARLALHNLLEFDKCSSLCSHFWALPFFIQLQQPKNWRWMEEKRWMLRNLLTFMSISIVESWLHAMMMPDDEDTEESTQKKTRFNPFNLRVFRAKERCTQFLHFSQMRMDGGRRQRRMRINEIVSKYITQQETRVAQKRFEFQCSSRLSWHERSSKDL